MDAITWIAEQRISTAISEGLLDNLPGQGKPLSKTEYSQAGANQTVCNILSNAGFLPNFILLRKEIEKLTAEKEEVIGKCSARLKHIDSCGGLNKKQHELQREKCILFFEKRLQTFVETINLKIKKYNAEVVQQDVLQRGKFCALTELSPLILKSEIDIFNQEFKQTVV